jgi:hypothetical protein
MALDHIQAWGQGRMYSYIRVLRRREQLQGLPSWSKPRIVDKLLVGKAAQKCLKVVTLIVA